MRRLLPAVVISCVALMFAGTAAPAAERGPALPLAGMIVNLDPGHNRGNATHHRQIARLVNAGGFRKACDTTGTATRGGWPEWAFTLDLARRTAAELRARGARVTFTLTGASPAFGPCIDRRATIGNFADVAVSLHADGNLARRAHGFHVIRPAWRRGYTHDIAGPSRLLATLVRNNLRVTAHMKPSNYAGRGGIDVRGDLGGLNRSNVPKVLLEAGNMKNAYDARLLRSIAGRQRMAVALADAIERWHHLSR